MPHLHEKIDFTVTVYIVFQHCVLLRMHDKFHMWLGPGGHIELDEDPNQAVVREAKEEVGLDIALFDKSCSPQKSGNYQELIPPRFLNRHRISATHEHVDLVYLATSNSDQVVQNVEEEKSEECRWFSAEELDDPKYKIEKEIIHYAKTALAEVGDATAR